MALLSGSGGGGGFVMVQGGAESCGVDIRHIRLLTFATRVKFSYSLRRILFVIVLHACRMYAYIFHTCSVMTNCI